MASIKGYKYDTEQQSINAQNLCNAYYGIPKSLEDITKNWVDYSQDKSGFYYIVYDDSLLEVLGEPVEFEITLDEQN